jgi:hypothetical protein
MTGSATAGGTPEEKESVGEGTEGKGEGCREKEALKVFEPVQVHKVPFGGTFGISSLTSEQARLNEQFILIGYPHGTHKHGTKSSFCENQILKGEVWKTWSSCNKRGMLWDCSNQVDQSD